MTVRGVPFTVSGCTVRGYSASGAVDIPGARVGVSAVDSSFRGACAKVRACVLHLEAYAEIAAVAPALAPLLLGESSIAPAPTASPTRAMKKLAPRLLAAVVSSSGALGGMEEAARIANRLMHLFTSPQIAARDRLQAEGDYAHLARVFAAGSPTPIALTEVQRYYNDAARAYAAPIASNGALAYA